MEFNKPSGSVLLESLAEVYGRKCLGVILTGMGADGAQGIKAISDKGGHTIAQDAATSVVFGMPKAAIDLGAVLQVLPLEDIAAQIVKGVECKNASRHI